MSEEPKKECPKEECPKEGCFDFHGFHGFGPRCHGPGMHPHKHKERKCECGEIIPKRKEGEPKIKVCPKCGKDLPKKKHGFGMRCHKRRKWMRFMHMMGMINGPCGFGFGPGHHRFGPPPPPFHRGLEVHHYIHFGPPRHPPMCPPGFGRPPMMGPPGFGFGWGRPPMGPPGFGCGRPPCPPGFGFERPPMGPPGFGMGPCFPPHGPHGHHGPHGPQPPSGTALLHQADRDGGRTVEQLRDQHL